MKPYELRRPKWILPAIPTEIITDSFKATDRKPSCGPDLTFMRRHDV